MLKSESMLRIRAQIFFFKFSCCAVWQEQQRYSRVWGATQCACRPESSGIFLILTALLPSSLFDHAKYDAFNHVIHVQWYPDKLNDICSMIRISLRWKFPCRDEFLWSLSIWFPVSVLLRREFPLKSVPLAGFYCDWICQSACLVLWCCEFIRCPPICQRCSLWFVCWSSLE